MTYLEKYKEEHPGLSDEEYLKVVMHNCPIDNDGRTLRCPPTSKVKPCISNACPVCWNQEIPGTENNESEDGNMSKQFTKKDLKVGYVVKYRNGNLRMVMPSTGGLVLTSIGGQWLNISTELNDDLTAVPWPVDSNDHSLDVMEVYGLARYGNSTLHISTNNRELLWKREEKTCDSCAHKVVCTHVGMCEHYLEKETSK